MDAQVANNPALASLQLGSLVSVDNKFYVRRAWRTAHTFCFPPRSGTRRRVTRALLLGAQIKDNAALASLSAPALARVYGYHIHVWRAWRGVRPSAV